MMRTPAVLAGCEFDKPIRVNSESGVVDKSPANPLQGVFTLSQLLLPPTLSLPKLKYSK
jgi:hypothetical protein